MLLHVCGSETPRPTDCHSWTLVYWVAVLTTCTFVIDLYCSAPCVIVLLKHYDDDDDDDELRVSRNGWRVWRRCERYLTNAQGGESSTPPMTLTLTKWICNLIPNAYLTVAYSGEGRAMVGPPTPGSDRELLNNVCTVSVSFFRDWIIKSLHVPRLCLLKMASKCSQTYHFLAK